MLVVGYWLLPQFVPNVPPTIDHLAVVLGWIFLVLGLVLLVLSLFGRTVGGRRYWY